MSELGPSIQENFEVLEYLGKSGKVLKARQRALDRMVVLKVCNPKFYDPEVARKKFIEEGRLLGRLVHPNLVQIYGVEEPPGEEPYLVMEHVEGTSLKQLLKKGGEVAREDAFRYMRGICAALDGIHEHGIVHRNLKPENLLVDGAGKIKLVDFGLALSPDSTSDTDGDVVLGTPIYMSPEQVRGKDLDARSDVYAAGVIFFELLTGRPPFLGRDPRAIMKAHVKKKVPDPEEWGRRLPSPVLHVLKRALAKRPKERYESASKLGERVEALARADLDPAGLSQALRRKSRREKSAWRARLKSTVVGVGTVGLLALGVTAWIQAVHRVQQGGAFDTALRGEGRGSRLRLRWRTASPVESQVEYGYSAPPTLRIRRGTRTEEHDLELTELEPGRKVFYRVQRADGTFTDTRSIELPTVWSVEGLTISAGTTEGLVRLRTAYPSRPVLMVSDDPAMRIARRVVAAEPGTEHEIPLPDLRADTTYHVQLRLEEPGREVETARLQVETQEVTARRVLETPGGEGLQVAPRIHGENLVLGTEAGKVLAFSRAAGTPTWSLDLGAPIQGALAEIGEHLVVRFGEKGLAVVRGATGEVVWKKQLGEALIGAPAVGEGAVVAATRSGEISVFELESGLRLWRRAVGVAPSASLGIGTRGGAFELVGGFEDGVVRGFGPGGRPLWQQPFGARVEAEPVFSGVGVGLVGGGQVLRMRESRKAPRFDVRPGAGAYDLKVDDEGRVAVVANREEGLVALDWSTGREVWRRPLDGGCVGPVGLARGRVYAATGDGSVACVAVASGELLWSARLGAGAAGGPVPSAEGTYVATFGGQVYRFVE